MHFARDPRDGAHTLVCLGCSFSSLFGLGRANGVGGLSVLQTAFAVAEVDIEVKSRESDPTRFDESEAGRSVNGNVVDVPLINGAWISIVTCFMLSKAYKTRKRMYQAME
jgi:hypothetical protein